MCGAGKECFADMKKINLCVMFGGVSPEHDISLLSASSVLAGLDKERYNIHAVGITKHGEWLYLPSITAQDIKSGHWLELEAHNCTLSANRAFRGIVLLNEKKLVPVDVVFPVLHGENGEDGRMQGLCELAGIPCVGPGCASSAVSMDKTLTKLVAKTTGVRQAEWVVVTNIGYKNHNGVIKEIEEKFTYPVFVKPAGTGSSVGTSKAKNRKELISGIEDALRFGEKALVEEFIDAREIETAVLGNDDPQVSVCGEVVMTSEFYSYESKYVDSTSKTVIPADISEAVSDEIRSFAKKIYMALGCKGLSRVDFFLERGTGEIVFNEINTIPGFTDISMYSKLFAACGIPFGELLDKIVLCALEGRIANE